MKKIVIMPGGFHPFHAGHLSLYQAAQQAFPDADVYVAATDDTSARPFPFRIKEKLAQLAGVKPSHFQLVKSPFQCKEITQNFDPNNTVLIYVRSEKDRAKPPQAGGVKKDGSPSYLQPLGKELQPMSRHAYMTYLPTVEFGPGITSATEIRTAWPKLNDRRKQAMVMSLYPRTQGNPKLVQTVIKMLDTAIGTELNEFAPGGAGIVPPPTAKKQDPFEPDDRSQVLMTIKRLLADGNKIDSMLAGARGHIYAVADDLAGFSAKKLNRPYAKGGLFRPMDEDDDDRVFLKLIRPGYYQLWDKELAEDYIEEKWSQKYKDSINCSNPKGFSQRAHCQGRKK